MKELICTNGGRCEIISGTSAHSAEVLLNDTFEVEREDNFRYFGKLKTKNGFVHEPGLQSEDQFKPFYVGRPNIECAVIKENVKEGEDSFWALWKQV